MSDRFRLLLVDDEAELLELTKELLTYHGFDSIITAEDGEKALSMMENEKVDMIISDLLMPNLNGLELFAELQKRKSTIPFLLVTGSDMGDSDSPLPGLHTLKKPYEIQTLVTKINELKAHHKPLA